MISFSILLFFAATGLTLNHQDTLTGEPKSARLVGKIDVALVSPRPGVSIDPAPIVAALRSAHHVKAALGGVRVDDDEVTVSFKGPGYAADAFIDRKSGAYEMNESRLGFIAVVNDLHKGRDTGKAWAAIIDMSAICMILVSLTGLTLIFFLQKRLATGLVSLGIGTALCAAVYLFLVS